MSTTYSWSYAPTNRATCKGACKEKIPKGALRLCIATEGVFGDSETKMFRCLACVTDKQVANIIAKVDALDKVEGYELLELKDQSDILAKEGGGKKPAAKGKAKAKAKAAAEAAAAKPAVAKGKPKAKAVPKRMPPVDVQHKFLDKAKDYDLDAVRAMLAEDAGLVNVQPCGRWSALHQFASNGNAEAVKYLLASGADAGLTTKDGQTVADVATEDCKKLLDEEGAPEDAEEEEEAVAAAAADVDMAPAEEPAAPASSSTAPARKAPEPAAGAPPAKKAKTGKPVDSEVPNRTDFSVVDDWSVLLNQTNVVANNNKYYKIQVLKSTDGLHHCWTHWGRVGTSGQFNMMPCGTNAEIAEREFKAKFKQKSGVPYENLATHDWTPKIGKYTFVETDEQEGAEGGDGAPLGKLTPQQIEKGQGVLQKIDAALGKTDVTQLQHLSSEFYTLIPHDFGFKVPPAITTKDMLESEEELLKFYLRMGFEEMDKVDDGLSPVSGIMKLDLPASLESACSKVCAAKDIKASSEKGKNLASKQSGNPTQKMEAHLYAALMLYTSNAIYRDLNSVLRSEDRTKIKRYFSYLRLFLEALGRLPQQKRTLWRGVGVDLYDQYPVGSTVTWWGVSSCTSELKVAKSFMKGCGGKCTLLTVEATTAADISEITFFGNEKENLLAPGTQLKVLSSKREGNITEIKIKEVGRVLE